MYLRLTARLGAATAASVAAFGVLVSATPMGVQAQSAAAFVAGAEAWTESDCRGDLPIVVGADASAQSDIYSAITLAGAIGTDCVVLAGARDRVMPASQRVRLDVAAAGGYVVGGIAAVRAAKVAGRDMVRVAGADRWATAQRVGAVAVGADPSGTPRVPSRSRLVPVESAGAHVAGGEGWFGSDCTGAVPIVVGSDAAAQSDIYSAVTFAGVLGTDCVVLAGARDSAMPMSQRGRLDDAIAGGWIVGGEAAVSAVKVAGRQMTRIAGLDRWSTADLVGQRARTASSRGKRDTEDRDGRDSTSNDSRYVAINAGSYHTCAIRVDGTLVCWGNNEHGQATAPDGTYTSVAAGLGHSCAIRSDGTVTCWGDNRLGQAYAPAGFYSAVAAGATHSCAIGALGNIVCWGYGPEGQLDAPEDSFTRYSAITASWDSTCALPSFGKVICWGDVGFLRGPPLFGNFSDIDANLSVGSGLTCATRTLGGIECWGGGTAPFDMPSFLIQSFIAVAVGVSHVCAIGTDSFAGIAGEIFCWGLWPYDPPGGEFTAIAAGSAHVCAIRLGGNLVCWGQNRLGQLNLP